MSLPGPDRTISDEDIRNRKMISRRYRNRRIGDFLKELKLVEGRNTGIPTILRAMEQNGSDLPAFLTDEERTYLTVVLPIHKSFWEKAAPSAEKEKKRRRSLAEVKELILVLLRQNGNLSSSELAFSMGYTKITSTVTRAIRELLAEGRVVYLDAEKLHSKNQKICLVEK